MRNALTCPAFKSGLVRLALAAILAFNLQEYFSSETLAGWDTIGHRHLYQSYLNFLQYFDSAGYDPNWFQGYPAFYFYPPLLYFCMAQLSYVFGLVGIIDLDISFNIGILTVILFHADSLFLLVHNFLPRSLNFWQSNGIALACTWMYFLYPGEGLQAAGTVGIIEGTINSGLGLALALRTILALDRFRVQRQRLDLLYFAFYLTLLFYAHYLSLIFLSIPMGIYFFYFWRNLNWKALLMAGLMVTLFSLPLIYLYFAYAPYRNGISLYQNYPALLSWLGTDFFQATANSENYWKTLWKLLLIDFKWIQVMGVILLASAFVRSVRNHDKTFTLSFLLTTVLVLGWSSQDSSLLNLIPFIGIHWYRTFDLFLSFSLISMALEIAYLFQNRLTLRQSYTAGGIILGLIGLRVFLWSPFEHQKYDIAYINAHAGPEYKKLEIVLQSLTPNSLILPELLREKEVLGSPHALDYWIQSAGHRNALGLTIESAPSARLSYAYFQQGIPWMFRWGISSGWDKFFFKDLPGQNPDLLIAYLKRSGIRYILGRSPNLLGLIQKFPHEFQVLFKSKDVYLYKISASSNAPIRYTQKPIAMLDYRIMQADHYNRASYHDNFLLVANFLRNRMPNSNRPIVDITQTIHDGHNIPWQLLHALIVFNPAPGLKYFHGGRLQPALNVPVFLLNLRSDDSKYHTLNLQNRSMLPVALQKINPVYELSESPQIRIVHNSVSIENIKAMKTQACRPLILHMTYFPDWSTTDKLRIYQTDTNQMLICTTNSDLHLVFSNKASRLITIILYFLTIAGIGLLAWSIYVQYRVNYSD